MFGFVTGVGAGLEECYRQLNLRPVSELSAPLQPMTTNHIPFPTTLPPCSQALYEPSTGSIFELSTTPISIPSPLNAIDTTPSIITGEHEQVKYNYIPVISWTMYDGMFYSFVLFFLEVIIDAFVDNAGIHLTYNWTISNESSKQIAKDLKCHVDLIRDIIKPWKVDRIIVPPIDFSHSIEIVSDHPDFVVSRVPPRVHEVVRISNGCDNPILYSKHTIRM